VGYPEVDPVIDVPSHSISYVDILFFLKSEKFLVV
jgi:hypothetical protein